MLSTNKSLRVSALALAVALGLSQPVAAEGLVAGLGSGVNSLTSAALGGGASGAAMGTLGGAGALDAALKTTDGTLKAAGIANGSANGSAHGGLFSDGLLGGKSPGILAGATGAVGADGKVTSIHPFGDDMVRVDLKDGAGAVVKGKPGKIHAVALSESEANALIRHAVPLDGIPQARSVRVDSDGSIVLGAEAEAAGNKTSAKSETSASASARADGPDAARTVKGLVHKVKDKVEDKAGKLPITADASRDGARLAAREPRGGEAAASVTR